MKEPLDRKLARVLEGVTNDSSAIIAANLLLEDEGVTRVGSRVALIDDTGTYPAGIVGVVKGVSAKGSGYVDIELDNGAIIPVMSSLLLGAGA